MKILPINGYCASNNRKNNVSFKSIDIKSAHDVVPNAVDKLNALLKDKSLYEQYKNYAFYKYLKPFKDDISRGVQIDEKGNLFLYDYMSHWGVRYYEKWFPLSKKNDIIGNFNDYNHYLLDEEYLRAYYPDGYVKVVKYSKFPFNLRDGGHLVINIYNREGIDEMADGVILRDRAEYGPSIKWESVDKTPKFDELYAKYWNHGQN